MGRLDSLSHTSFVFESQNSFPSFDTTMSNRLYSQTRIIAGAIAFLELNVSPAQLNAVVLSPLSRTLDPLSPNLTTAPNPTVNASISMAFWYDEFPLKPHLKSVVRPTPHANTTFPITPLGSIL